MHHSFRFFTATLPLAGAVSGCGLILGIDDFKDAPATGGGGTTTTPTGGTNTGGDTGATDTGGTSTGGTTGGTSTGGTTGGTGGTTGTICPPNEPVPCYEGPEGTEGVGICTGGTAFCSADGMTLGPCMDQVVPQFADDCGTPSIDEDCDNLIKEQEAGCCVPLTATTCYNGPPGTAGIGLCKSGTYVCPSSGIVEALCPGEVLPTDEFCAPTDDEDCNGKNCWVWTKHAGDFGIEFGTAVATDGFQNRIVVGGHFTDGINLGGGFLNAAGNQNDVFLAAFSSDMTHLWSKKLGVGNNDTIESIQDAAWDSSAGIAIVGYYLFGDLDMGGGLLGVAENFDGFFARYDEMGNHLFSRKYGGTGNQTPYSVKIAGDGIFVAGDFEGQQIQLGDDGVNNPLTAPGGGDAFLAKYDRVTSQLMWAKIFGSAQAEGTQGNADTMDADVPSGTSIVVGTKPLGMPLVIDNFTIPATHNLWVAKRFADGNHQWAKGFAVTGYNFRVALAGGLGVYIAGTMNGSTDLGGGELPFVAGGNDIVVAHYDIQGNHLWSISFTGNGNQSVTAMAADKSGVWIAGTYDTPFTVNGQMLPAIGQLNSGSFVIRLNEQGSVLWHHAMGGAQDAMTIDTNAFTVIAGDFNGNVDLGGGPLSAVGSTDFYLTRLGR